MRTAWIPGACALAIVAMVGGCAVMAPPGPVTANAAEPDASVMTPNDVSNAALLRSVQQSLNEKGYDAGVVDGHWSPVTAQALRRLQIARGLPPTADLDPQTMAALGLPMPTEGVAATQIVTDPSMGTSTYALPARSATTPGSPRVGAPVEGTSALPPPMTPSGTTPSGMTTPGATPSGATTRPAAGTPPEQSSGTAARTGVQ